jgi:hypothetical protein
VQKLGPFHSSHHRLAVNSEVRGGVNGTIVTDAIELKVAFGWTGKMIERLFISRQMQQTFHHRQQALPKLLAT